MSEKCSTFVGGMRISIAHIFSQACRMVCVVGLVCSAMCGLSSCGWHEAKGNQSIVIEDLIRIDYVEGDKNSFTVFVSNDVKVKRLLNSGNRRELKDLNKTTYDVKYDEDLVINGLGFVKIVDKGVVDVYIDKNVDVFLRKSLI